ncbi:MAG TPA: VOC family protein [Ktedonobacterales bacterium]
MTEAAERAFSAKIGHAHLKVRDLDRAVAFYERFLKFGVKERVADHYVFMTGGAFHHEIALQRVAPNAPSPSPQGTGLYHVAFEVPSKRDFAAAYATLRDAGIAVAPVDHYISWAMYFDDPDGNGLEIYCDTRGEPDGRTLWAGDNIDLPSEKIMAALGE